MIAKNRRLTKEQVKYIQKKGDKFESKLFIIKHKDTQDPAKYCIIISKKFAAKAVERNKLRRQIYEIIRKNEPESVSKNLILIPKKSVSTKTYQEIEDDINEIFKTING